MQTATRRCDVAEHLRTPEEMAANLEACLEEAGDDAAFVAKALDDIARAKGMTQVARDTGLSRNSLYKALSGERSPGFDTILRVVRALGLELHVGVGQLDRGGADACVAPPASPQPSPRPSPSPRCPCRARPSDAETP